MNGLISFDNISLKPIQKEILDLNEFSGQYGLSLTEEEAREISEIRNKAIIENDRIEMGSGVVPDIIKKFCTSHYVTKENYAYIINEVTYLFYYIKSETDDKICDADLIDELFKRFELHCRGSIDDLQSKESERIIRKINSGDKYVEWYADRDELNYDSRTGSRETPANLLLNEYGEEYFKGEALADHDKYEEDVTASEKDEELDFLDAFDEFLDSEAVQGKSPVNPEVAKENPEEEDSDEQ